MIALLLVFSSADMGGGGGMHEWNDGEEFSLPMVSDHNLFEEKRQNERTEIKKSGVHNKVWHNIDKKQEKGGRISNIKLEE